MDDRTLNTLEFQSLVSLLARHVQTPQGRSSVEKTVPSVVLDLIRQELALTTECVNYRAAGGVFSLSGIEETRNSISELQVRGSSLEPSQILGLERLIAVGADLREQLRRPEGAASFPRLHNITSRLPDLRRLLASI